ncbi:MAG TPA: hypothetical protein PKC39_07280 [Ferruginibacter sp.]|nr:hypothetical protein [Ferruginibacter sp.]HMP20744.1 hypothetical protein [Ferruginibacter sp.]
MSKKLILAAAGVLILLFSACKKQTENFQTAPLSDYVPLEVGKYIIYQLDSFVYMPFGTRDTTITYQVKYTVAGTVKDGAGHDGFLITREIRKTPANAWGIDNSFQVFNKELTYEFSDNNLKFISLAAPIKENFSWKGNSYLPDNPYPSYDFTSDFMSDWDYIYTDVSQPLSLGTLSFDNSITVLQRDDVLGDPAIPGTAFAERTYSIEKYAKGVGLVYKDFLHWEYQGANPGVQNSYKGFGIKLTAIAYN